MRGSASSPAVRLTSSTAVVLQGGALEGELALASRSRATVSGTRLASIELTGRSILETRGTTAPALVEPGSSLFAHAASPRLTVDRDRATLTADGPGLAWLGLASGLGFGPVRRPPLEGVFFLEPATYAGLGGLRRLIDGEATWPLGPMPAGQPCYLQGFAFDPATGRICFSDVARVELGR